MPRNEEFWNPYRMVPVAHPVRREAPVTHERFQGHEGRMVCTLENLTPLFVSRGNVGDPRVFMTRNNREVIPGSSLKGALRSLAEIVGAGCCVTDTGNGESHRDLSACSDAKNLCVACRMFGMMERDRRNARIHMGKVGIGDALLREGETPDYKMLDVLMGTPATRHRSFYLNPATGDFDGKCRKLYFHQPGANNGLATIPQNLRDRAWRVRALTAGHHFDFEITFSNLTDAELALLIYVVALEPAAQARIEETGNTLRGPLRHKIGNAKPLGLGSCHIDITRLDLYEAPARRYISMSGAGTVSLDGKALAQRVADLTRPHANDTSPTMRQLRKMLIWNDSDNRTFHYPSYNWFKGPGNPAIELKRI